MEIKYLRTVKRPREQVGEIGDVRDVPEHVARPLLDGGYAELIGKEDYVTEGTDTKSKRPAARKD